jgi:hypothetical protein
VRFLTRIAAACRLFPQWRLRELEIADLAERGDLSLTSPSAAWKSRFPDAKADPSVPTLEGTAVDDALALCALHDDEVAALIGHGSAPSAAEERALRAVIEAALPVVARAGFRGVRGHLLAEAATQLEEIWGEVPQDPAAAPRLAHLMEGTPAARIYRRALEH